MLERIKKEIKDYIDKEITAYKLKNNERKLKFEENLLQNGKIWSEISMKKNINCLGETEFKVFSQWGDDGIIQYLVNYLDIKKKIFVEFGVEDYKEANTRFLLINNNWSGLVIDNSTSNINTIKTDEIYWKYDLVAREAFVTKSNINRIIEEEGFKGEIGLLHIDIDGNDYWIWKEIKSIDPIIVIVEYNSVFGNDRAITIPYQDDFNRFNSHYSGLYAGTSITALYDLAQEKGYDFIGSNSAGNNAYFVKKGYTKDLKILEPQNGYVESKFRESRDKDGNLDFKRGQDRIEILKGMPIFNTRTNQIEKL